MYKDQNVFSRSSLRAGVHGAAKEIVRITKFGPAYFDWNPVLEGSGGARVHVPDT